MLRSAGLTPVCKTFAQQPLKCYVTDLTCRFVTANILNRFARQSEKVEHTVYKES